MDCNYVLRPSNFRNNPLLNADASAPEQVSDPIRRFLNGNNVKVFKAHGYSGTLPGDSRDPPLNDHVTAP
jgi:hypothetical protein